MIEEHKYRLLFWGELINACFCLEHTFRIFNEWNIFDILAKPNERFCSKKAECLASGLSQVARENQFSREGCSRYHYVIESFVYFLFLYAIYVFCCLTIVSFKRKWEGMARMRFSRATLHTKPIMYFVCFFTLFFLSKAQTYLYIIIFQPNCLLFCQSKGDVCDSMLRTDLRIFFRDFYSDIEY